MNEVVRHSGFNWPNQARACISLSYDDGEPDNLEHAMPDLEDAGFRGTFYLYKHNVETANRISDWKAAFARGHEIGNHTTSHPCRSDAKVRAKPLKNALENYTLTRIQEEVQTAANWLDQAVGPDAHRTFAYPCGATAIGLPADEQSYRTAISSRHTYARDLKPLVNDPVKMDPLRIGSFMFQQNLLSEFTDACELALRAGGWSVLVFHSIDGPNHGTSRQVHQQLIAYLKSQPVWVAPVREVTRYISSKAL